MCKADLVFFRAEDNFCVATNIQLDTSKLVPITDNQWEEGHYEVSWAAQQRAVGSWSASSRCLVQFPAGALRGACTKSPDFVGNNFQQCLKTQLGAFTGGFVCRSCLRAEQPPRLVQAPSWRRLPPCVRSGSMAWRCL